LGRADAALALATREPEGAGCALEPRNELRVEARDAIPLLARWLEDKLGVVFSWNTIALGFDGTTVAHSAGKLSAGAVVIAPGASVSTFAPDLARRVTCASASCR
jgi:hypothetical protein